MNRLDSVDKTQLRNNIPAFQPRETKRARASSAEGDEGMPMATAAQVDVATDAVD